MAHETAHKFFSGFRVITRIIFLIFVVVLLSRIFCNKKETVNNIFAQRGSETFTKILAAPDGVWTKVQAPKGHNRWSLERGGDVEANYPGNATKILYIAINGMRDGAKYSGMWNGRLENPVFNLVPLKYLEFAPAQGEGTIYFRVAFYK